MKKKAILVTVELTTRVLVNENATDEQIAEAVKPNIIARIQNDEVLENMTEVKDDEEMPYGSLESDKQEKGAVLYPAYYQPDLDHPDVKKAIMKGEFNSFDVFAELGHAKEVFPGVEIKTYYGDDIEDPNFVDDDYEYDSEAE